MIFKCRLFVAIFFSPFLVISLSYGCTVRRVAVEDIPQLINLYKAVAAIDGGIARSLDEINQAYVSEIVSKSITTGLMVVAINDDGVICGAVSKYRLEPKSLSHCLGGGTTLVHPSMQGKSVGAKLWESFIKIVQDEMSDISRIELFVRESNSAGIRLYSKVGFSVEGKLSRRIVSTTGVLEADLIMGWLNPNFKQT